MSSNPRSRNWLGSPAWWALGLLLVLMLPTQVWLGESPWLGDADQTLQLFGLGAAHVLATLITSWLGMLWPEALGGGGRSLGRLGKLGLVTVAGVGAAFGGLYVLFATGTSVEPAEGLFAVASVVSGSTIGIGLAFEGGPLGLATICAAGLAGTLFLVGVVTPPEAQPARETLVRTAGYHRVGVDYHNGLVTEGPRRGGGLALVGRRYVRMTGSGVFHEVRSATEAPGFVAEELRWPSPLNLAAQQAAIGDPFMTFRAHDLIAAAEGDDIRVFAAHHFWHADGQCYTSRLSAIVVNAELRPIGDGWRPVYDTAPCLTPFQKGSRRPPGITLESGGRLAWLEPGLLLMTVGDQGFDGWNDPYVAPQSDSWDYGKTILIDVDKGSAEPFVLGQRNPQGLHVDRHGRVWSSEHGPEGGDELNLLVRGENYGWPYRTYGTDYGRRVWPLLDTIRAGFVEPEFAWLPSVGVSDVLSVPSGPFERWEDDLLVASLRGLTLYHIGLAGDRIVYSEPIPIGRRIRDLVYGPEGSIWLWTDGGDLVTLTALTGADRGEELFSTCAGCHLSDYDDRSGGIAPTLRRIVNRPIGALSDFEYSPALEALDGRWTPELLDRFLADPVAFAPGTSMAVPGISDPQERAALIERLRELR